MHTNQENWNLLLEKLKIGDVIKGRVFKIEPYGVYVNIGEIFHGIILAPHIGKPNIAMEEYPKIGVELQSIIVGFSHFNQEHSYVSLSIKHLPEIDSKNSLH
jgi:ribosomal protein S1